MMSQVQPVNTPIVSSVPPNEVTGVLSQSGIQPTTITKIANVQPGLLLYSSSKKYVTIININRQTAPSTEVPIYLTNGIKQWVLDDSKNCVKETGPFPYSITPFVLYKNINFRVVWHFEMVTAPITQAQFVIKWVPNVNTPTRDIFQQGRGESKLWKLSDGMMTTFEIPNFRKFQAIHTTYGRTDNMWIPNHKQGDPQLINGATTISSIEFAMGKLAVFLVSPISLNNLYPPEFKMITAIQYIYDSVSFPQAPFGPDGARTLNKILI